MLKKSDLAYKQEGEGTSHVYRLVLKPDNTARVEIDGEKIYEGSLKEDQRGFGEFGEGMQKRCATLYCSKDGCCNKIWIK